MNSKSDCQEPKNILKTKNGILYKYHFDYLNHSVLFLAKISKVHVFQYSKTF